MNIRKTVTTNYGDWLAKFGETWKSQTQKAQEKLGPVVEKVLMPGSHPTDVPILIIKKEAIVQVLQFLKDEPGFEYNFLADLTATDEQPETPRFTVVYNLFSTVKHWRIRVKALVDEDQEIPTATKVWPAADWLEREVFDMYGVRFAGHPNLRRILMDERWQGHPLRKDYPLRGYQIFTDPQPVHKELLD